MSCPLRTVHVSEYKKYENTNYASEKAQITSAGILKFKIFSRETFLYFLQYVCLDDWRVW